MISLAAEAGIAPEANRLTQIEAELAQPHGEAKKNWVNVYHLLREVEESECFKPSYKSLHLWLVDYCRRTGLKTYPVYRRRLKAGQFYEDVLSKMGAFPPIDELDVSAESVLLINKLFGLDEHLAVEAGIALVKGQMGRGELEKLVLQTEPDNSFSLTLVNKDVPLSPYEIPGLELNEIITILEDENSWLYRRIDAALGRSGALTIDPSAKDELARSAFAAERGNQSLWNAIRPYVYEIAYADDESKTYVLSNADGEMRLDESSGDNAEQAFSTAQVTSVRSSQRRGPKPQRWYNLNNAKSIDTVVSVRFKEGEICSESVHRLAYLLSSGPGSEHINPTPEDRDGAELLWFSLITMSLIGNEMAVKEGVPLGMLNGIIENGNNIMAGRTTRLDNLFYSTDETGIEGFEQSLYRGHAQVSMLAVEALACYRKYRDLTKVQRDRSADVAASYLSEAVQQCLLGNKSMADRVNALFSESTGAHVLSFSEETHSNNQARTSSKETPIQEGVPNNPSAVLSTLDKAKAAQKNRPKVDQTGTGPKQ